MCGEDCRVEGEKIAGEFTGTLYEWQTQVVDHLVVKLQSGYGGGVLLASTRILAVLWCGLVWGMVRVVRSVWCFVCCGLYIISFGA